MKVDETLDKIEESLINALEGLEHKEILAAYHIGYAYCLVNTLMERLRKFRDESQCNCDK